MPANPGGADEQLEPPDDDPDVAEVDPTGRYFRVRTQSASRVSSYY